MWHALRYGLRRLARSKLVSVTVMLTLAVGVGAVATAGARSPSGWRPGPTAARCSAGSCPPPHLGDAFLSSVV